jgi:hypothetical protein
MFTCLILSLVISSAAQGQPASVGSPPSRTDYLSAKAASPKGGAILLAMVLPGSGQYVLGAKKRGEGLMWLDASLWAFWTGFSWFGSSREHDARLFAAAEAGADLSQKASKYYKALERYDNSDLYNEDVRKDARDLFPDDPDRQHEYYESQGYFGAAAWNWSSDSSRINYWRTRKSGRSAALTAQFLAGALLLNRLASVVDCAFFAGRRAAQRVEVKPADEAPGIRVCYRF